jgi:hypothetical protein
MYFKYEVTSDSYFDRRIEKWEIHIHLECGLRSR